MKKRILSFALAVLMVVACIPAVALPSLATSLDLSADLVWYAGNDGEVTEDVNDGNRGSYEDISYTNYGNKDVDYTWTLSEDGVLTVSGNGAMPNLRVEEWPWHSVRNKVTKVVVLPGLTTIGQRAFCDMPNLTEAIIPEGVTQIYGDGFSSNAKLEKVTFPSTMTTIHGGSFYNTHHLKSIVVSNMTADELAAMTNTTYNDDGWSSFLRKSGDSWVINPDIDVVTANFTPIVVSTMFGEPNPGWQNWDGLDNETILFVRIHDAEGNPMREISKDLTWQLTFAASGSGKIELGTGRKTITMSPVLQVSGYEESYAFTPCLGEGDNKFVPIKGVTYTLTVEVFDAEGKALYKSAPAGGFTCGVDPKVPEGTYPTNLFLNPECYIETDLGSPMPVDSIKVQNYPQSTCYKWLVYATNDKTLPINQWEIIGGKITDETYPGGAEETGYTARMAFDEEGNYEKYQYIRIYGIYHSGNIGFHFNEVELTVAVEGNSHIVTWVVEGQSITSLVADGEVPVCPITPSKAPTMDKQYTFTGWDKELVPATETATYVAQFEESVRPARVVTLDGWGAMENWNWGGVEKQTQLLMEVNTDDPCFDGGKVLTANNYNNFRWVITFDWTDGEGNPHTEKHTMTPWSTITESNNFRFRLVSGPDAFVPEKGVAYTVNVDLYDMTLTDKYGPAGYHAYTSEAGRTHVLKQDGVEADSMYNDEYVTADDFCTITWKLDEEVIYTSKVLKGLVPTYPGTPLAETVIENGIYKTLVTPTTVAATEDTTYTFTYSTDMTLGIYNNTTWENWPDNDTDTQLLLMVYDKLGNTTPKLYDNKNLYDWAVVIDGVEYKCAPDSSYITEDYFSIYRFEIAKYGIFVPEAGKSYEIGLKIYDKEGNLVAESTNTIDSTVPEDFEPIVKLKAGDIDQSGSVTIGDVTKLLNVIAGKGELPAIVNGDLDGSGSVTISDVTVLLNVLADKETL